MDSLNYGAALRSSRESNPASIPQVLTTAAAGLGATDVTLYLVDYSQTTLEPLHDDSPHVDLPSSEDVATTMPGRAFRDQRVITAERGDDVRVWVPVIEGSNKTGVLALTLTTFDEHISLACEDLGMLAGYLLAALARYTVVYNLHRRRKHMSLAASMQWDLLPPLAMTTHQVSVAGIIEPAYDVGGDCFDYAVNGNTFDFAIIDALGHGVASSMIASLAIGSYRHDRRQGSPLTTIHTNLDRLIRSQLPSVSFATGLLGRLALDTGTLTWTNAGHPLPLLIRGGSVVKVLQCRPTPPWGVAATPPEIATEMLEPGDHVLAYTDGVTEARTPTGDELGAERFIDMVNNCASDLLRPQAVLQTLVNGVRMHLGSEPRDDATIMLMSWAGPI